MCVSVTMLAATYLVYTVFGVACLQLPPSVNKMGSSGLFSVTAPIQLGTDTEILVATLLLSFYVAWHSNVHAYSLCLAQLGEYSV